MDKVPNQRNMLYLVGLVYVAIGAWVMQHPRIYRSVMPRAEGGYRCHTFRRETDDLEYTHISELDEVNNAYDKLHREKLEEQRKFAEHMQAASAKIADLLGAIRRIELLIGASKVPTYGDNPVYLDAEQFRLVTKIYEIAKGCK